MNTCRTSLALFVAFVASATAAPPTTAPSYVTLRWLGDATHGFRPSIELPDGECAAPAAVIVDVLPADGDSLVRTTADYATTKPQPDGSTLATAKLATAAGSTIDVEDRWTVDDDAVRLARTLTVRSVHGDRAFGSDAELAAPTPAPLAASDVFMPGLWYATDAHTPPGSLVHPLDGQRDFLIREDRCALPLVSVRDRASGWTLMLVHERPDGATIADEGTAGLVIDGRLQYGAIGLRRETSDGPLRVAFRFPGGEGEQTRIKGYRPTLRTAERLHPMTVGATQRYTLAFRLTRHAGFSGQMRDAWRNAYAVAKPEPVPTKLDATYRASLDVLAHYAYEKQAKPFGTVAGIPFSVQLADGVSKDPSLQMGFVGQQLPCASYLIDEGLRSQRPALVARGERIADFWSRESLSAAGVPRTWFDLTPQPHWRDYDTYLRVATDGTSGLLRAWQLERDAGRDKPKWLAFCRAVGDWLLKVQHEDGSFDRSWTFDGKAKSESRTSTLHPVRLLVDLSCATGDAKYRAAAVRAAEYALEQNADGATYVGGTPDNPDVTDKEAGWIAFDSYLALYDVTRDQHWLAAATDAATFTETWIYGWGPPLPESPRVTIPRLGTYAGAASLIATGHSGADLFLAYASLSYARLALYAHDEHFADVARLLQANTAQLVDTGETGGGSLPSASLRASGYPTPGLCVEAFTLGGPDRGHSVRTWLPWCTSAVLEPMARCREIFGTVDVAAALSLDPVDRERRHLAWAQSRGFAR